MKFYFFNCYKEGRNKPSKHLQKFYLSINSNQDIDVHFTKETYLVGFELVFVYQRKHSIHQKYFSWSTKKLWHLGVFGQSLWKKEKSGSGWYSFTEQNSAENVNSQETWGLQERKWYRNRALLFSPIPMVQQVPWGLFGLKGGHFLHRKK